VAALQSSPSASPAAFAASAAADATDDYPIPHRMIITTCTAEQILAAAKDFAPIYYQRYIIDKHNKPPEVQQAAIDSAHYFYALSPADRRAYSEQMATNFADPMTTAWPNWAKIFFNNKGVAAKESQAGQSTREGAAREPAAQYGNPHGAPRSCRRDRHIDPGPSVGNRQLSDRGVETVTDCSPNCCHRCGGVQPVELFLRGPRDDGGHSA
jgi:hypothetical protein